jgi:hypothetical protein
MRKNHYLAAFAAAATLVVGAQSQAVVTIQVGEATGAAGSTAPLSVSLSTGGVDVAGTQNDIAFPATAPIAAKANGRPDCAVNPDIMKGGTSFAFQPAGCTGTACTGVRALVLALDNVDPITDGATLYTCNVAIGASATGTLPLTCSNSGSSSPTGTALDTTCTNGSVVVGGGGPTPTPTEGAGTEVVIHVGSTSGGVSQPNLSFDVTLETPLLGTEVAGTQNDITFSGGIGAAIQVKALANGRPDCAVNPDIEKGGTSFAFQPSGCSGEACTGVRALVLALDNVDPIPNGSTLYTCQIQINGTAAPGQTYPLTCSNSGASDPAGGALTTSCTNGAVEVGGAIIPTSTPTVTGRPTTVVGTPTNTPTGGVKTATSTPARPIIIGSDDDACAIVSPATTSTGWMVLLPAAALLWLRRRSR